MKSILALLVCLFAAASAPAIVYEWTADIDRPAPASFALADGETADLACRLVRRGRDFDPSATSATLYYQTNGMGRSWWSSPATVTGALLRASLPPSIAPAAPVVHAVIGASGPSGLVYRAAVDLRYLPSPGATPNALPLPVQTLDFSTVSWTNAPWALASDVVSVGTNFLPLAGGTVTGDVFLESTASSRAVSVVVSGDLYYLTNYDSPITVSFSLPNVASATVGDTVSATYSYSYSYWATDTWTGTVSSIGASGISVLFSNGVSVSGIAEGGVASVSPSTLYEGRMSIAFSGVDCSWAAVPVVARSRFVTESDLVAATNALYQLLNH